MVKAKKSLGQHFLIDPLIISQIIEALNPNADETILEIGPGEGILTGPLVNTGADIVAVELDRRLAPKLEKEFKDLANFRIIEADILITNPVEIGLGKFAVAGNLPYNITTPVMDWLLDYHDYIDRAVFMMQLEVAERVISPPGRKARSTISVLTEIFYDSQIICKVPPESFKPRPKVDSAVVKFVRHDKKYSVVNFPRFTKFVRFCFASKRKNLVNNLNSAYPIKRDELSKLITRICGSPQIRAEQLELDTFIILANEIFSRL